MNQDVAKRYDCTPFWNTIGRLRDHFANSIQRFTKNLKMTFDCRAEYAIVLVIVQRPIVRRTDDKIAGRQRCR